MSLKAVARQKCRQIAKDRAFYMLLFLGIAYFVVFHYVPMYGIQIAFKNFSFKKGIVGSPWVGLDNFRALFAHPDFFDALKNTVIISLLKIAVGFPAPIILALALNGVWWDKIKRPIQSISYLPHFLSWVVMSSILTGLLSTSSGPVNQLLRSMGIEPINFMGDVRVFRSVLVLSDVWKDIGWGSIIYLAALSGVDMQLYEAATVDGASKWKQLTRITLPSIAPTIITMFILRIGGILNAGMEQIYAMYSPPVYPVSDILDTLALRIGIHNMQYGLSTAISMFKSVIGFVLIVATNRLAKLVDEDSGIW